MENKIRKKMRKYGMLRPMFNRTRIFITRHRFKCGVTWSGPIISFYRPTIATGKQFANLSPTKSRPLKCLVCTGCWTKRQVQGKQTFEIHNSDSPRLECLTWLWMRRAWLISTPVPVIMQSYGICRKNSVKFKLIGMLIKRNGEK